jgi:hypothetical protein
MNATEAELDAAAKAFVDKYAPNFDEKPFIMFSFMTRQVHSAIIKQQDSFKQVKMFRAL